MASAGDPRGKDPGPWDPELLGTSWYTAGVDDWDRDSAFSELLYLPGNSVAVSRLHELQRTDLTVVHLLDESSAVADDADFAVLTALLGQAIAHRGDRPGSFYWHLPDLTGYALVPPSELRYDYVAGIGAWKDDVDALYGAGGLGVATWRDPLAVREAAAAASGR